MTRTGETILQASAWHGGFPPVTAAPLRPKSLQTGPEKALRCSPGFGFAQHCALLLGRRALPYNPPAFLQESWAKNVSPRSAAQSRRFVSRGPTALCPRVRRVSAVLGDEQQPLRSPTLSSFRPPKRAHLSLTARALAPRLESSVTPGRAASPSAVCPAGGSADAARSACRPCRSCSPPGSRFPGPGRRRFWEWPPTPWR